MTYKTVEIHHDGEMRLVARTGSGHEVVMDDRNGDSGPRPTELVLAGLGGCVAMDVTSIWTGRNNERSRVASFLISQHAPELECTLKVH